MILNLMKTYQEMRINTKKLPVKYYLDIYQEVPGYPSHSDLQYVLLRTLQDRDLLEKDFTAENVWPGMKNCLGTIEDLRGFLEYLFHPDDPSDIKSFYLKGNKTSANSYCLESHEWM